MSNILMKFKKNEKVVFSNKHIPNNLVMNVARGTYKSAGMEMVQIELPGGLGKAFASELRRASQAEILVGTRDDKN